MLYIVNEKLNYDIMKNFLILLILLCGLTSTAQYKPFIDESKTWVYFEKNVDSQQSFFYTSSYYFATFKGDTVINNSTYAKCFYQRFYREEVNATNTGLLINDTLQTSVLSYFIREDTTLKKVWKYTDLDGEKLVYDFSVNVGDTMLRDLELGLGYDLILDSVSQTKFHNKEVRDIFY